MVIPSVIRLYLEVINGVFAALRPQVAVPAAEIMVRIVAALLTNKWSAPTRGIAQTTQPRPQRRPYRVLRHARNARGLQRQTNGKLVVSATAVKMMARKLASAQRVSTQWMALRTAALAAQVMTPSPTMPRSSVVPKARRSRAPLIGAHVAIAKVATTITRVAVVVTPVATVEGECMQQVGGRRGVHPIAKCARRG